MRRTSDTTYEDLCINCNGTGVITETEFPICKTYTCDYCKGAKVIEYNIAREKEYALNGIEECILEIAELRERIIQLDAL